MAQDPPSSGAPDLAPGVFLGRVGGVPVYLGRAWAFIGIVMVLLFGPQISQSLPDLGLLAYGVAAAYAVLLLLSVFLHEAAHAVVARACGMRVTRVVADLWGGHTAYDAVAPAPGRSALVAVVGPLANAAAALVGWWFLPGIDAQVTQRLVSAAVFSNAFVAAFNLLPGLPLDGGFLLEALVWKITGNRNAGLVVAGWSGRLLTVGFLAWALGMPILRGQPPDLFSLVWMIAIGAFLWAGATQAIRSGRLGARMARLPLEAVRHPAIALSAGLSVADALDRIGQTGGVHYVVLLDGVGEAIGLLDVRAATELEPSSAQRAPASSVLLAQPAGWVLDIGSPTPPTTLDADKANDTTGGGETRAYSHPDPTVARAVTLMVRLPTAFVALRDEGGVINAVLAAEDVDAALSAN